MVQKEMKEKQVQKERGCRFVEGEETGIIRASREKSLSLFIAQIIKWSI